jgi:hypothetical protein
MQPMNKEGIPKGAKKSENLRTPGKRRIGSFHKDGRNK